MSTKGQLGDKLTYPVYKHFVERLNKVELSSFQVLFELYTRQLGRWHWKTCVIMDVYDARVETIELRIKGYEPEQF